MTDTLHIQLLGEYRLASGGTQITTVNTDRLQSLLTYLLLHRNLPQPRRRIAQLLWTDSPEAQARSNLRNLLFQLRQALPGADALILADSQHLQWNPAAPVVLDVAEFEQALAAAETVQTGGDPAGAMQALARVAELYAGELLPGSYDDWIMPLREELRTRYTDALALWVQLLTEAGDLRGALRVTQRLLQQDLLNESTYVQLMHLHAELGDRAGVQRVYESCVTLMQRELEVEPSPVTQAAYAQAMARAAAATPDLPAPVRAAPPPAARAPTAPPAPTRSTSSTGTAARRMRLPAATTPFVGRETELAELALMLGRPEVRLLTIVGPGGIGKTRLALQTGLGHQTVFAQGAAFVPLAGVDEAHLILPAIADVLGLAFAAASGVEAQFLAALHDREMLLILDNAEQLLDGVDLLSLLLSQAPGIRLLVTSRERLGLQEEWVYNLHGLPVPDPREENLEENTSAALFLLHAHRTRSDFSLPPGEREALRRIYRMTEGMPLALELAASWVRLLSCPEIADEIARSLDFLGGARRNAPDRHPSIRAVFEHSWALLSPAEQQVFSHLAVFRGGFDREAGEQIAGATLAMLSALVDKSLIRRVAANRYDIHELLRQFTLEKLRNRGDLDRVSFLHLAHYLALAETAEPQLNERDQAKWLRRLDQESDNFQAALEFACEADDFSRGMRLASALWRYWLARGANIAYAVIVTAGALAEEDPTAAVPLLGAALAMLDAIHAPLSPINQDYLAAMLAPVRSRLGEAPVASLLAEGRSLSRDEALARIADLATPTG